MIRAVPARVVVAIIVIAGSLLALGVGRERARRNEEFVQERLRASADRAATNLMAKLKLYEYGVRGVRAALIGAGGHTLSRERFAAYIRSRDLPSEFPGALGFAFVRRVRAEDQAAYVEAQRRSGAPDFSVHFLGAPGDERFLAELVEPLAPNASALGLDVASEPRRRAACLRARQTGEASITAPIDLVQLKHGMRTGFLLFLPVTQEDASALRLPPEEATLGWACGIISLAKVLATFDLGEDGLTMELRDVGAPGRPSSMFRSPGHPTPDARLVRRTLNVFGRTWELELIAGPRFVANLRLKGATSEALVILAGSLLFAFAPSLYLGRLEHARKLAVLQQRELEERVAERTDALRSASTRLELLAVQLHTAQRIANMGSWEYDVDTRGVVWSEGLFRVLGVDPSEGVPDAAKQPTYFTEETWERLTAATQHCIRTGEAYEVETTVIRPDGERRMAITRAEALRGPSGNVARVVGTLQDVSARERTAAQLRIVSERLKLATSAAQLGIWETDLSTGESFWDETTYGIYRCSKNVRPTLATLRALVHPDDQPAFDRALELARAGAANFEAKFRVLRPDGEVRHIHAQGTVQPDASGAASRIIGVNRDITEAQRLEAALRSSESLQRTMLAHAGSAIIAAHRGGMTTLFNHAAEKLLGYAADEVIGRLNPLVFHDPEELDARRAEMARTRGHEVSIPQFFALICAKGSDVREWTYVRKDGGRVPVLLTMTSIHDGGGEVTGYLGVAVDLTARKEHERALLELNQLLAQRTDQAESASRAKSMFLANMSHEIRTPIGAITGLTYLLSRTQLSAEQQDLLRSVERSTKTLLGMVDDVLDLSKIEAEQLVLESVPFVLGDVLGDLSAFMHAYATGKQLALSVEADDAVRARAVEGDRMRLMQVLTNLVGNAIKYTDRGSVRIQVTERASEGATVQVHFEVRDTGEGIASDFLPRLFDAFAQAESQGGRQRKGTGLGLAIVKQLVTMMGGTIAVHSELGAGSCFSVTLPFARALQERGAQREVTGSQPSSVLPRLGGLTVLVADDNEINRDIARSILELEGATVHLASDGAEAVDIIYTAADEVDLVLMDVQMPVEDGVAATRRIRADPRFTDLPILALTAGALATERERALAAGMTDFVTKPYDAELLIERVREYAHRARRERQEKAPHTTRTPSPTMLGPLGPAANGNAASDRAALERLLAHVRSQDFEALTLMAELRPALEEMLGARRAADLREALERLDFGTAEAVLAQLGPTGS